LHLKSTIYVYTYKYSFYILSCPILSLLFQFKVFINRFKMFYIKFSFNTSSEITVVVFAIVLDDGCIPPMVFYFIVWTIKLSSLSLTKGDCKDNFHPCPIVWASIEKKLQFRCLLCVDPFSCFAFKRIIIFFLDA
jgi:hypothetical protein